MYLIHITIIAQFHTCPLLILPCCWVLDHPCCTGVCVAKTHSQCHTDWLSPLAASLWISCSHMLSIFALELLHSTKSSVRVSGPFITSTYLLLNFCFASSLPLSNLPSSIFWFSPPFFGLLIYSMYFSRPTAHICQPHHAHISCLLTFCPGCRLQLDSFWCAVWEHNLFTCTSGSMQQYSPFSPSGRRSVCHCCLQNSGFQRFFRPVSLASLHHQLPLDEQQEQLCKQQWQLSSTSGSSFEKATAAALIPCSCTFINKGGLRQSLLQLDLCC